MFGKSRVFSLLRPRKLQFPENGGRETRFSVAGRNFFGGPDQTRGLERERERARVARSSWVPHRHNTSHYVIRASLDTAIYHSSARTPIYRSSPYACKTLLLPLPPSPPLGPALLFVYEPRRKEGARSRAENNRGGDRGNDISLMNIVSREWGKTRIREIDI